MSLILSRLAVTNENQTENYQKKCIRPDGKRIRWVVEYAAHASISGGGKRNAKKKEKKKTLKFTQQVINLCD